MDYKIYDNVLTDDVISYILTNLNEDRYTDGRVSAGSRVNKKQKNRKDLFINDRSMLNKIDDTVYNSIYDDVKSNFSDINYRENWKLGKYLGDENGFYNVHRDDSDETAYRSTSMICALSDENDYTGGELCFDSLKKNLKLEKGSIVVFKSSLFHHVTPVTSGTRIVLISFFFDEMGKTVKQKLNPKMNINFNNYKPVLTSMKLTYDETVDDQQLKQIMDQTTGDIDYCDNNQHPWTNKDDFWFEDNNADTLLVSFAGMGWKKTIPTFIFYNFFGSYTNMDKLFLRDIDCRYYMTGLKNTTNTLEDTVQFIKEKIDAKKYKRVLGLGCSAGAFAAILYGQLLNFDKVIAFAPQTVINHKKEDLIEDIFNAPNTCKWLRNRKGENELYQKSLDLASFKPFSCPVDIHYSVHGNKGIDKKHALYLEDNRCKLFEHPGNNHMIALTLKNNGKLRSILEKEINP
jgi:predicted 2-oxoglutarate/Fe(II)-dependent dioxygenase YbiX